MYDNWVKNKTIKTYFDLKKIKAQFLCHFPLPFSKLTKILSPLFSSVIEVRILFEKEKLHFEISEYCKTVWNNHKYYYFCCLMDQVMDSLFLFDKICISSNPLFINISLFSLLLLRVNYLGFQTNKSPKIMQLDNILCKTYLLRTLR